MLIAHGTHPGETGKNNEDRYAVTAFDSADGPVILAVVADGIGGHQAGEVASQLAVETISAEVRDRLGAGPRAALAAGITAAARLIAHTAESRPEQQGMGTTCAVVLVAARRLHIATIGDSRIYLIRGGVIQQLNVDHTFVQEALELGILSPEEAHTHPQRHVLRRHMGKDPNVQPDFRLRLAGTETAEESEKNQGLELRLGDTVLLCSDGLSDLVGNAEMREAVLKHEPQAAVDELIALACRRGGYDNITVVVLKEN
jgi:protein phosphatase